MDLESGGAEEGRRAWRQALSRQQTSRSLLPTSFYYLATDTDGAHSLLHMRTNGQLR
jgi:hypothetical protein